MSLVGKGFQIVSLVGAISSVPLIPSFSENQTVSKLVSAGGDRVVTPKVVEGKGQTIMQKAMEQMAKEQGTTETAGLGCFWMPGLSGAELFFCFDKGGSNVAPFLFHYSYRGGNSWEDKLQKVERISKGTKAHLKQKGEKPMQGTARLLLSWTQKWPEQTPFDPSQHCQVFKQSDGNYKITCTSPSNSADKWEREISKSHIVDPQPKVQGTV